MEIKKGDKVKFLNEKGGGIIIRLIDNRQAMVQIEDGFEIPVLLSNLIKTEATGEKNNASEKRSLPNDKPTLQKQVKPPFETHEQREAQPLKVKDIPKPLLAFVPVSKKNENPGFELHLLNNGDYYLYYTVAFEKSGWLKLHEKGELEPQMKLSLGTFAHHEILKINSIILDFLVYKEADYTAQLPLHFELAVKNLNLLREANFKANDFFYEDAFIIDCNSNSPSIDEMLKNANPKEQVEKKPLAKVLEKSSDLEEIDLHIEEIVDVINGLSPVDILNIQMARFTTTLEGAVIAKTKRIVFIHGVGNGKLKFEIRKTLDTKYSELKYQDASFAEYGFGATMVIIR